MIAAALPVAFAIVEKSTGIEFPANSKLGKLRSLGVRKKGPIKVYAVGMYEDIFKSKGFMLQMAMGVSAHKMTNVRIMFHVFICALNRHTFAKSRAQALIDAVKPRLKSDYDALEKFSDLLLRGLPNGCARKMCLLFGTSGGKLSLAVDGELIGAVSSKPLTEAFVGVYCDASAVCKLENVSF